MNVLTMGLGYVGLPLALRSHEVGLKVQGFDPNRPYVQELSKAKFPQDVSLEERLSESLACGFSVVSDPGLIEPFDYAIICVPTPLSGGNPDLQYVIDACNLIGEKLQPNGCVILESTTFPFTSRDVVSPLLARVSGLREEDFHVGFSPERIDPGNNLFTLENTPKIVSGLTGEAASRVENFYKRIGLKTVRAESCEAAELAKLVENTFRQVNIALVNEVLIAARKLGVDPWGALGLAATKPFGFMPFSPGPGVGGHCLPIDPVYLSWKVERETGFVMDLVNTAQEINAQMPEFVADRAVELLESVGKSAASSSVTVLGLSYKANSRDFRESPTFTLLDQLSGRVGSVAVLDPVVGAGNHAGVVVEVFSKERMQSSDLVIIMVQHDLFEPDMLAANCSLILDTRNVLAGIDFQGSAL